MVKIEKQYFANWQSCTFYFVDNNSENLFGVQKVSFREGLIAGLIEMEVKHGA